MQEDGSFEHVYIPPKYFAFLAQGSVLKNEVVRKMMEFHLVPRDTIHVIFCKFKATR